MMRHASSPRPHLRFYTIKKTADLLNVSESRVKAMLENGELEGLQLVPPAPWLVDARSLQDYVRDGDRQLLQVFRQPERSLTAFADD
jgi:hypothetical protein